MECSLSRFLAISLSRFLAFSPFQATVGDVISGTNARTSVAAALHGGRIVTDEAAAAAISSLKVRNAASLLALNGLFALNSLCLAQHSLFALN